MRSRVCALVAATAAMATSAIATSAQTLSNLAAPPLAPTASFGYMAPPPGYGGPATTPPPAPTPSPELQLPSIVAGALPVQANNKRAPPILIHPRLTVLEGFDDNPHGTPNGMADSLSQFEPGVAISADSVRFQGQLNYALNYLKYARASDEDRLNQDLAGYGLFTGVPGFFYVDGRAAISQVSRTGGFAFSNPSFIPKSQSTEVMTASVSPILEKRFGNLLDTRLRYTYGVSNYSNDSLLTRAGSSQFPALSNITQNEIRATAATLGYGVMSSRLTLDALKIDSQSVARSTQLRAYDDFQYHIDRHISLITRLGYENLRFPLLPIADVNGPTWLLGGRLDTTPGSFARLQYGHEAAGYGFVGDLRQKITEATAISASYQRSLASAQQQILFNLNNAQQTPYGSFISQRTGLPTGLANPEFAYSTNSIFRYQLFRFGVTSSGLGRNTYSVFAFLDHRTSVGGTTTSDTARGVNLILARSMTPRLTGVASLGYASHTPAGQNTWTADISFHYAMGPRLSAILRYQFFDREASAAGFGFRRNILEVGVTKAF